ncbi:MAG: hypothetical protein FWK04_32905, partial [Nostoc sp. GBBB01]|nr:hypothetical protein [Nostoc sp. GBBB01]
PTLIDASESSHEDALTHIAEVATVLTNTALRRIVDFSTPQVKADLLMIILRCLPSEVYSISLTEAAGLPEEAVLSPCTVLSADSRR